MGDYSYTEYKSHKIFLKQADGSPVNFDKDDGFTSIEVGIKAHRFDGSPPRKVSPSRK
jgi:hypothetical protein